MTETAASPADLAQRTAQLEGVINNAVDAIITIDPRGIVVAINPSTERMFGYSPMEVIGQNIKMLMPAPYAEEHDGYLANYLRSGQRKIIGIGREVTGKRKDGSTFPMHLAVSEASVGERLFTGIVRDISDLKRAEANLARMNEELEQRVSERTAQLEAAQEMLVRKEKLAALGQIAGGIAHEIRNPLNAIKTSAYYLLNASNASAAKVREHLTRIDRQVTLADNAVTALSDFARLPEPERKPVPLEDLLRSVVSSIGMPDEIEVSIDVPVGTPEVFVDENQIPIVFRNLLRNARDAMPEGGRIVISAAKVDDHVRVAVADNGEGMTPDVVQRVMEPLFTTKARGMGLGLAISRAIIQKHDGRLEVASEYRRGSTFSVELPLGDGQQREQL
jgi:two-component system sensor kinase FixL